MPIWTNKACTITYDQSTPYIMAQWLGNATSFQFREVHEKLLAIMQETKIYKLLADNTHLPEIDPDDNKWFNNNWLPRAIKAGYSELAIITVKSRFSQITIENFDQNAFTVKHFDNTNKAKKWLIDFKFK